MFSLSMRYGRAGAINPGSGRPSKQVRMSDLSAKPSVAGEVNMTDKKATKRRSVSKPRLLKELYASMNAHDLTGIEPISDMIEAIERDIIEDSMK